MERNFRLKELNQIGIVVRDLDEAMRRWSTFGVGPWSVVTVGDGDGSSLSLYGEERSFVFRGANAMLGNVEIELLQPISGDSPHAQHLLERGEGVHHLGFNCENPEDCAQELEGMGYRQMMRFGDIGPLHDGVAYYMNTTDHLTVALEFVNPPTITPDCFRTEE